jgi:hypothetical protein
MSAVSKKERKRSSLGTYLPEFDEELVKITVKIPKSMKEKLEKQEVNKSELVRELLKERLKMENE